MSNPDGSSSSNDPLVEMGWRKIWWAERHMRLLRRLREEFERTQPFAGLTIGMCIHVEPKTAVLCMVLRAGGAKLVITGSPGTTKDDVAAALRSIDVTVLGTRERDQRRASKQHPRSADPSAHAAARQRRRPRSDVSGAGWSRRDRRNRGDDHRRQPPARRLPGRCLVSRSSSSTTARSSSSWRTSTASDQASSKASCARRTCSCSRGASSSSAMARSGAVSRGGCDCSAGMSLSSSQTLSARSKPCWTACASSP